MTEERQDGSRTRGRQYTERLLTESGRGWKVALDVQRPYRWNLGRLHLGRCLDVGCGVGRNLAGLPIGSVGVDHNEVSVAECRRRGLEAYTPEEFRQHLDSQRFDSMLLAHVLEHVDTEVGRDLIGSYLHRIRPGGKVVLITPQERGYASDATHVRWVGFEEARSVLEELQLHVQQQYSFPFPRLVGRVFFANEFVTVASVPEG